MNRDRLLFGIVAALALTTLSACVLAPSEEQLEKQQAAIDRWDRCTTEHATHASGSLLIAMSNIEHLCDGHRRDVLATFPPHLEKRLNTMLVDRTRQMVVTQLANSAVNDNSDHPVPVTLR